MISENPANFYGVLYRRVTDLTGTKLTLRRGTGKGL